MEDHKIHTRSSVSGKDNNYNMKDSQKGKGTPKSTPSKQRKPNQTNNSLQKAVEPEAHASLFKHAPVIQCKKCEQAINKGLSVKYSSCEAHFCRSCTI